MNPSLASIGDVLGALFGAALVLGFGGIVIAILLHVRKRRLIARDAERVHPEQLEAVYSAIDDIDGGPPVGCLLARTNEQRKREATGRIAIPAHLEAHPWAGRTVSITPGDPIAIALEDGSGSHSVVRGRVFRAVDVPRTTGPSGKPRNVFQPSALLRLSPSLEGALETICPRYPEELLAFLLCAGGWSHEYEPCDQIRIGATPAWVQSPEHRRCPQCGERMRFALQVQGTLFQRKSIGNATFFVLACGAHPDAFEVVSQLS